MADPAGAEDSAPDATASNEPSPERSHEPTTETVGRLSAELDEARAALGEARARAEAEADRALRAAAEAENARKRAERTIDSARKFALEQFVRDLLPAVDSFEQAVAAAADAQPPAQTSAEGVGLALKLLVGALERHGVAPVDPVGAPFDPKLHEAMSVLASADAEPDSVAEVLQKGYTLNGRLVRPARVVVAKAPPAQTDAVAEGAAAEDSGRESGEGG